MKYLKVICIVAAFVFCLAGNSFAQNAPALKIAYVDLTKVFDEYGKTKEFDAVLEKKQSGFEAEHKDKLQKIKDAEGKMAVLKEEERNKVQAQIDKDKADLLAFDREKATDLKKERDEKIKEILGDIEKTVKDYATKESYTYVLNDRVLIYGVDSLNITTQVIKLLNDKYSPPK